MRGKYINFQQKFVEEVDKVLKVGGVFAYSDFRPTHEWDQTEQDLLSSGLVRDSLRGYKLLKNEQKIVKKEDISENVMKALKLDEERKWKIINSRLGPGKY